MIGVLLLSWWTAAGAVLASDAGLRLGADAVRTESEPRQTPLWIDHGRSPIATPERRGGGAGTPPPERAAVVHVPVEPRAGLFRPLWDDRVGTPDFGCVSRGRQTRGPPSL
jgi:hypothetical protein